MLDILLQTLSNETIPGVGEYIYILRKWKSQIETFVWIKLEWDDLLANGGIRRYIFR